MHPFSRWSSPCPMSPSRMAPNAVPRAGWHFLAPVPPWLHIKLHCPFLSFQIPQPAGTALHPKRNQDLDESGHSSPADSPSQHPLRTHWLPRPLPSPHTDPHPALPFRVPPALPCSLCGFTVSTVTLPQKHRRDYPGPRGSTCSSQEAGK